MSTNTSLSKAELEYTLAGCEMNMRVDGRSCSDTRPYLVDIGPLLLSNGSARVSLVDRSTDIMCSVKAEIVKPAVAKPNLGIVEVNVELLGGTAESNKKKRRTEEMELSEMLTNLLTKAVNLEKLQIVAGKYCWKLNVDLLVLACDGSAIDTCGMAAYTALNSTYLPSVTPVEKTDGMGSGQRAGDDFIIDSDVMHAKVPPGANDCPITITVCRLGKRMVVDSRVEEEACASAKVSVSVNKHGMICGVHKCGSGSMPFRQLGDVTGMAVAAASRLYESCLNPSMGLEHGRIGRSSTGLMRRRDILSSHLEFQ